MPFILEWQQYLKYSEKISQNAQDHTGVIFVLEFRAHLGGGETPDFVMIYDSLNYTEKATHKFVRHDMFEKKRP